MMKRWRLLLLLFILAASLTPSLALSNQGDSMTYDRVHLAASATGRVENDTLIATLSVQQEGKNAAKLADSVNQSIRWGIERVKVNPVIKVRTQAYSTQPIYHKNNITGWRVSQSIRLESQDMTAVSEMLGELQSRLTLQGIQFSVSPEQRNTAENGLISEALAAFATRAKLITSKLGHGNYRLVDMHVSTSGAEPRFQARAMHMEMRSAPMDAPSLEAGESTLTVTVSGEIEVK